MATVYVSCTDNFMSGWGQAEGLTNKLIFVCDSMAEAEIVFNNAKNRTEMRRVKIHTSAPSYFKPKKGNDYKFGGYYVQIKTKDDYTCWYKEGFFQGQG